MSTYCFIGSDYELPEVDNTNARYITVREAMKMGIKDHEFMPWESMNPKDKVLLFANENDLDELVIRKGTEHTENTRWYTNKPLIYTVEFRYTEDRGKQLLQYLREHTIKDHELELWCIWLDEKKSVQPKVYKAKDISIQNLNEMFGWRSENHENHSCIVIKK